MKDPNADLAGKAAALEGELLGKGEGPASGEGPGDGTAPAGDTGHARTGPTNAELLTALLRPTFDIMAPNWQVSDMECALLGEAYCAVIDKYFPGLEFGIEIAAVLATAAVFGPRMRRPTRVKTEPVSTDGKEEKSAG